MRKLNWLSLAVAWLMLSSPVHAQMQMNPATPAQPPAGQAAQAPVPVLGEITRVDTATGRLGIRHEPIPNLDMGAMNMLVRVADPAMLTAVAVGDKVIFEADRVDGQITILKMIKAAP